jgi:CRP-like cAMP-binding protein
MKSLADSLRNTPLFKDCSDFTISNVCDSKLRRLRKKPKDAHIAYMNDTCSYIVVLVEGSVYTSMTNDEGKEVVLEVMTGPLVLAPAFVYSHINQFPVNVVAQTECTLLYIDKDVFSEMLAADSRLMMNYVTVLSNRCYMLSRHINNMSLMTLKQRVVEYLKVNKRIDSVQWLSRLLGVTRPSLSRVISELKAEGLIKRTLDGLEMTE